MLWLSEYKTNLVLHLFERRFCGLTIEGGGGGGGKRIYGRAYILKEFCIFNRHTLR